MYFLCIYTIKTLFFSQQVYEKYTNMPHMCFSLLTACVGAESQMLFLGKVADNN